MRSRLIIGRRHKILQTYCAGKKVLDLGCVDHEAVNERMDRWTHRHLAEVARSILGIDILEEEVAKLQKKGFNIRAGNVENLDLDQVFEVVLAGELIEHVRNQEPFLQSVRRHMHRDGVFVFTTPNATSLSSFLEVLLWGRLRFVHPTHLLWHDANTVRQLLEDNGYEVEEISFVLDNPTYSPYMKKLVYFLLKARFLLVLLPCLLRRQFAPTLLVVARLKSGREAVLHGAAEKVAAR
ncbi:MAG TPA: class I SAM-dependent methyltransferase [Gemmataceae bacterium]|jgi:SAM-dependent methyltransferase|nr:class I SAM-dependent methyltransferase [Gemmataceae bacterium]